MILYQTLVKLGIRLDKADHPAVTDAQVTKTLEEVLVIYDVCLQDVQLSHAAYGLAVGGAALALNCTLHTAVLLVEHQLVLRGIKDDQRHKHHVFNIRDAGANERYRNDDRPSLSGQGGNSESADTGAGGTDPAIA